DLRAFLKFSFFSDDVADARDFGGLSLTQFNDFVQRVGNLACCAGELHRHARLEIALLECRQSVQQKPIEVLRRQLARSVNANAGGGHGPLSFRETRLNRKKTSLDGFAM